MSRMLRCAQQPRDADGLSGGFARIRDQVARDGKPNQPTMALVTAGRVNLRMFRAAVLAGQAVHAGRASR
jgi:hypothetical protein